MEGDNLMKQWLSEIPKNCQLCDKPLGKYFIDGNTKQGWVVGGKTDKGWALMCEDCHKKNGVGLGIGKGQKYNTKSGKGV
jgi:hypothetical protein